MLLVHNHENISQFLIILTFLRECLVPNSTARSLTAHSLFNVKVGAQSAQMKMTPVSRGFSWESYNEDAASHEDDTFTVVGLLEQINTTRDVSDYLWYMTE